MVIDRTRVRHRLGKFLLRHGRVWREGEAWTLKHQAWVASQRFGDKAMEATFAHYRVSLEAREAAVEADLTAWFRRPPFADAVARLGAYRGITHMGALHLASEVCDWRRSPTAGSFMGFTGLTPSEYSSGERRAGATSPMQAACTCARNWSSRPGPTRAARASAWSCAGARRAWRPRPWPGPGAHSYGYRGVSVAWTSTRPTARWS